MGAVRGHGASKGVRGVVWDVPHLHLQTGVSQVWGGASKRVWVGRGIV